MGIVLGTRGMAIVQENEPGIPAQLMACAGNRVHRGRLAPHCLEHLEAASTDRAAYLGGVFESGGGVELGLVLFGLAASGLVLLGGVVVLSAGGVAVDPGAVD